MSTESPVMIEIAAVPDLKPDYGWIIESNSMEFYLIRQALEESEGEKWGIYKYSAIWNEWENVMKYPPKYLFSPAARIFDKEKNKILT